MPEHMRAPRACRSCGTHFDNTVPRTRKFCSAACQKDYHKALKTAEKAGMDAVPSANQVTPYVKAMHKLAFDDLEDNIREVLREETRKQVNQHLKDNILGAAEALTALLPKVLVGLAQDAEHEDWMRRSRAQALIMKYAFGFKDAEAEGTDRKVINIFHGVPVPDTALGDNMLEVIEGQSQPLQVPANLIDPDGDPEEYVELPREAWEATWPTCRTCGDRKHPETFALLDQDQQRGQCRTCHYQEEVRKGFNPKHTGNNNEQGDNRLFDPED